MRLDPVDEVEAQFRRVLPLFLRTRTHTSIPPFVNPGNVGTNARVLGSSYAIFDELTMSLSPALFRTAVTIGRTQSPVQARVPLLSVHDAALFRVVSTLCFAKRC